MTDQLEHTLRIVAHTRTHSAFAAGACPELSTFNLDSNMMGASGALFLARAFRDGACQNLQVRRGSRSGTRKGGDPPSIGPVD